MRLISPSTGFFGLAALAALTVVLPVSSSGCGRTSCFVFSQTELAHHGGACPAQADALANFTDVSCPGPVNSVDGEGVFTLNATNPDQSLCCYPVTQRDLDPDALSGECIPPGSGGAGGTGGFDVGSSVVGVGVGGGTLGCVTCSQLLEGVPGDPKLACSPLVTDALQSLAACACSGGPCAKLCGLNLCKEATVSMDCRTCLEDTATSGCETELLDCEGH
jgi:hypothetical protein